MNRYEAIFGLGLATALVLDACGPAQATATDKLSTGDGGGQAGEVENIPNLISDIRAEKIDLSQSEMDAFNTKLQNPETQVVKYVAQGDGYIVTEIDPEVRHDAVCLEQERWGVEGSDVVDLCSTLIEGQELILTNNDRDELVALMPFTVVSGIEGYAGLAQDGKTIVPILARGSDGEIYVYNQDTLQYHPLGGETQILDILDIDELFLKNGGGTVVDSRSRGVGHVTRLRFANGIEAIQTPDGSFVSPQFIDLQTQIAAAGESFTLLPNGTIEQMTEGGAVSVPGLAVDKNGAMTLSVGGEFVTLDPAEVKFDDEKGFLPDGYILSENGDWVEAEVLSEARQQVDELVETYELTDSVTVTENDGVASVTDNETGKVLFETDGEVTKYEIGFAVDIIAAASCEPTEFKPRANKGYVENEDVEAIRSYMNDITGVFESYNDSRKVGNIHFFILINRALRCWGLTDGIYMYYRDGDGMAKELRLIDLTMDETFQFIRLR